MAINVKFYTNNSELIAVDKDLTEIGTKSVIFKEDVNILTPQIILSDNINCNYAYISDFGRYYYVTKTNLTGGRYRYDFKVDVLMSFKNDIRKTTCTVTRNEYKYNGYLADSKYISLAYKEYITKIFPRGLNGDSLILNTLG